MLGPCCCGGEKDWQKKLRLFEKQIGFLTFSVEPNMYTKILAVQKQPLGLLDAKKKQFLNEAYSQICPAIAAEKAKNTNILLKHEVSTKPGVSGQPSYVKVKNFRKFS